MLHTGDKSSSSLLAKNEAGDSLKSKAENKPNQTIAMHCPSPEPKDHQWSNSAGVGCEKENPKTANDPL